MNKMFYAVMSLSLLLFLSITSLSYANTNYVLGTWTAANTLTGGMSYGSCFTNGNYAYCAIGNSANTVDTAPITNNVIGTWTTTNSLTSSMNGGSCFTNNNYAYCALGGIGAVDTAPITNNVIGTWTAANALTGNMNGGSCFTNDNYAYCAIGNSANTVDTAPITNNVIGTWTAANALTGNMNGGSCFTNDNYAYCALGSGATVDYAPITNNVIGTWTAANSLTSNMTLGNCFTSNNYAYCALGNQGDVVYTAPITNNVIGTWTTANSLTNIMYAGSCFTNENYAYCALGNIGTTVDTAPIEAISYNTLSSATLSSTPALSATLDIGQNIIFTATAFNGLSPYTYNYIISNSITGSVLTSQQYTGVSSTTNTFTWTPTSAYLGNTIEANVVVTDSEPLTVNSIYIKTLTLNQKLAFNGISYVSINSITQGSTQTFTANIVGGTPSYTYNMLIYNPSGTLEANQLETGVTATSNSFAFTQNSAWGTGTFTANVYVTDSSNSPETVSNSITYTVSSPSTSSGGGSTTQYVTLNDNVKTTQNSTAPIFNTYIKTSGSGNIISNTYYQSDLPVTITLINNQYLVFSVACGFTIGSTKYSYTGDIYGLGYAGCNNNNTVYAGSYNTIYSSIQNSSTTSITTTAITTTSPTTVVTTVTPPPAPTTVVQSSNHTQNASIQLNTSSDITIPSENNLSLNADSGMLILRIQNPEKYTATATIFLKNVTNSSINLKEQNQTLLSSFEANISSKANLSVIVTLHYSCSINSNSVSPYLLRNNSWVPITPYSVNASSCSVSFSIPTDPVFALFFKNTTTTVTTILPSNGSTNSSTGNSDVYILPIIVLIIIVVLAWYFFTKDKKRRR